MVTPADKIIKELQKIDAKLIKAIEKILGKNPSQRQLLQFLNSNEYTRLIEDLGLRDAVAKYVNSFNFNFQDSGYAAAELTQQQIATINANLDMIKNSYGRTILGYYKASSEILRTKLIASVIEGVTAKETIVQLAQSTPLTTAQATTVVQTSYYDYSRAGVAKVFEKVPEQRFYYEGGTIPTSSDECRWLYNYQNPEGYTMAEINLGIETPFFYTSGDYEGEMKKIYWFGRLPNYNCIHSWQPIESKK